MMNQCNTAYLFRTAANVGGYQPMQSVNQGRETGDQWR